MISQNIYFDHNATTRLDENVLQAMLPFFTEHYQNPGSSHLAGLTVNESLDHAYWQVADLIGSRPDEVVFTSGATESINLAVRGISNGERNHLITLSAEHKAVLDTIKDHTGKNNSACSILPVQDDGLVDPELLEEAITDKTLLVSIMLVNNETGTIQDIKRISELVHAKGAFLLCDATQAVGKIPVNVQELGIDMMAFSAHKFYGPKGVGALYISRSVKKYLEPQITGGGQQKNRRSGTLNVPGIIGMAKACEIAKENMDRNTAYVGILRDDLESRLLKIEGTAVNGSVEHRIFNTSNMIFKNVFSELLIMALQHISVSSGSACSSVTTEPSHVLKGLGLSDEDALCSIRFSLGKDNTKEEIDVVVRRISELVAQFREG
ncbi:cysteine desulfurase [Chryseobacterium sp. SN22]|uniref:cysteine desulfurase family protein n=1 Tax=Chryseobacterium sp. SN22 TaxID=2606431 RepID=UPI0011ED8660|nr:cysteine desulfurase family protein [Chryseobacterium sp. SN22]KAA0129393.1 cysteine desulfurase [Chryseobacterium sp. SN22]